MVLALGNRTFGDHGERRRLPHRGARDRPRRSARPSWPMPLPDRPAQGHGLPDRRHRQHGRADGRRPGRRPVPEGVRRRGHHLGAPGHRGPGLQRGRRPSATPPRAAPGPRCAPWCGSPSAPPPATSADGRVAGLTPYAVQRPGSRRTARPRCGPASLGGARVRLAVRRLVHPACRAGHVPAHVPRVPSGSSTSAKMGPRQDRAPTTGPKKERPDTSRRPVTGRPAYGAHAWRT